MHKLVMFGTTASGEAVVAEGRDRAQWRLSTKKWGHYGPQDLGEHAELIAAVRAALAE